MIVREEMIGARGDGGGDSVRSSSSSSGTKWSNSPRLNFPKSSSRFPHPLFVLGVFTAGRLRRAGFCAGQRCFERQDGLLRRPGADVRLHDPPGLQHSSLGGLSHPHEACYTAIKLALFCKIVFCMTGVP